MVNTNEAWPTLRPFQRKIAILHTALDLIYTLDFISDEDKSHIVSLAPKNKPDAKPIIARMALHRAEGLETEIQNKILGGIEKLMGEEMTHDEVCDAYVQNLFVSTQLYANQQQYDNQLLLNSLRDLFSSTNRKRSLARLVPILLAGFSTANQSFLSTVSITKD
jgi:hypothetical protein